MAKPKTPEAFLYTLQTGAESYIITKWDNIGFEQLSQYIMPMAYDEGGDQVIGCTCPQGLKPTCRHRKMFPRIKIILDTPSVFYRYGDDRFLGIDEGRLRALTEEEQFALEGREPHPLSAEPDLPVLAASMYGSGKHSDKEVEVAVQLATNPNELLPSDEPKVNRRGL